MLDGNLLKTAGLTKTQSAVLAYLLENGQQKAREIAKNVAHSRVVVYKALDELEELALIQKLDKKGAVSVFRAEHPSKIENLFDEREKLLKQQKRAFSGAIPDLVSLYNLSVNKPGVRFFEGEEGIKKVLDDTLKSETEILMFINSEALSEEKGFRKLDEEYVKKRKRLKIAKRIIDIDSEGAKKDYEEKDEDYNEITQVRYIKKGVAPFKSSIQVYHNKISYQILDKGDIISVIIEDRNIYWMHRVFFEYVWNSLDSGITNHESRKKW